MNQVNANIILAPTRLNRPLPTIYARCGHSFAISVCNIPDDVTSVSIRVFKVGLAAFFDAPVSRRPDGTGSALLIGTFFPDSGSSKYEIHAFDRIGNPTALGAGYVNVEPFSTSGTPIVPGTAVVLDHIKDANGGLHTIKAVPDISGGYTTIIDDGE